MTKLDWQGGPMGPFGEALKSKWSWGSVQKCRLKPKAVAGSGERLGDNDHVRFTPNSGHVRCNYECPLWAKSGPIFDVL
jgi:hypothetical protein